MSIKIKRDHFTVEEVAEQWNVSVKELESLIYERGLLRLSVVSADVEEIANLTDPLSSIPWYGKSDPLDLFAKTTGLNLPRQDRQNIDLSKSAWGVPNPPRVKTELLSDLPKFLYLKLSENEQDEASNLIDSTKLSAKQDYVFQSNSFEIFSGERVCIVYVEDVNFNLSVDEPNYYRRVLNIEIGEPVISIEERDRFIAEHDVEMRPLGDTERENLLKLIAVLAAMFSEQAKENGSSKYFVGDKVNAKQVAEAVDTKFANLEVKDIKGVGVASNERKISEGLRLLKGLK
jgi:bifunctional DNA-binding transcriptional regulator/antitoxin component of YhaV-PrlF toxin-antitoxin module